MYNELMEHKLSEILESRGYVYQISAESLPEITDGEKRTLYLGVDPTADSMHVGQLQGVLVLRRFLEDGHSLIILVGGGTGMIGDPGGKGEERNLQDDETVDRNTEALRAQFTQLLGDAEFIMVNNADWLRKLNLLEFLRDIGKHFSVNEMIKRDTVRPRLETPDATISFTEFSYSLLQAYDFLYLHERFGVDLQVGGSDQWGNILPGVDLIRRKKVGKAYAFSWPLLINKSTGKKFGKSEGGAIWLDPKKTSPYQFYQFWLNAEDDSVEEYLKKMTMLSIEEIGAVMQQQGENPGARIAQKQLAEAVTTLVHGKEVMQQVQRVSRALFSDGALEEVDWRALDESAPKLPVVLGSALVDVIIASALASSKREAREFIENGAISINDVKVTDVEHLISETDFNPVASLAILKRGKRNVAVLARS
jgi:tyrosyl-tRNA synthetase